MRSTRRPERLAAGLALAASLAACREPHTRPTRQGAGLAGPRRGGTFRFAWESDVATLDPALVSDVSGLIPVRMLHECLVDYSSSTAEVVPALAERWTVGDEGLRYTFRLRPGARFANGREITSRDVVYSWERMLDARRIPSPGADNYRLIAGFEAYREGRAQHLAGLATPDSRTVVVTLSDRDRTFLHSLALRFAAVVPREEVERLGDQGYGLSGMGAGPFVLTRWEPGFRMELRRNPYYWDAPRPYVDRVVYDLGIARHLQFMRFVAGEYELAHNYSLGTADYLWIQRQRAWRPYAQRTPVPVVYALMMNTEMPPFDNVHVRRAVAYALDREALARARNYRIQPAWTLYPPTIPGHRADAPDRQRYDVAEARREMALAGYPSGYPHEVELAISDRESGLTYGQLTQADLAAIGLRVRLRQMAGPVYLGALARRRTVQLAFDGWQMDFPDPANFAEPNFHSRNATDEHAQNHAFYRNAELDRLLDRGRVEPDDARRLALYQDAERILLRDAPWAFVYNAVELTVTQPYVRDWHPHPVWPYFPASLWLDLPTRAWSATRRALDGFGELAARLAPVGGMP